MVSEKFTVRVATLFGLGWSSVMPGTIGALFGTLFYAVVVRNLRPLSAIFTVCFMVLAAIMVCDVAAREIGEEDPPCIIFDEFVAMPVCFLGVGGFAPRKISTFVLLLTGFVIFRTFDILKPFGIKKIERLSGGIGIVADDIAAAIYTNAALLLICLTVA
ncbi:MAG: phosphatidylglycerophosphatase A [Puniceicoccales bacterium]|nr:phosphatidylglycerophosphatase A [Puniceicoccales bacterium]